MIWLEKGEFEMHSKQITEYEVLDFLSKRGGATLDTMLQSDELPNKFGLRDVLEYLLYTNRVVLIVGTKVYSITRIGRFESMRHAEAVKKEKKMVSTQTKQFAINLTIGIISALAAVIGAVFAALSFFS